MSSGPKLLSKYLAAHDLGQAEFAERVGVWQAQISRLLSGERGERGLTNELAQAIEAATAGAVPARSWLSKKSRLLLRKIARRFA